MREWISRRINPVVVQVAEEKTSLRTQAELCAGYQTCIVARGVDSEVLLSVSRQIDIEIFAAPGPVQVFLYLNFGEVSIPYNSSLSVQNIIDFISEQTYPVVIPLERRYLDPLFNKGGTAIVLVREKKQSYLDREIEVASEELRGKIVLLICDVTNPLGKQVQEVLKIPDVRLPCIRLIICGGGSLNITQYAMLDEITAENILNFFRRWKNADLSPFVLTQDLPKKAAENRVVNLVGRNFKEVVYDEETSVFVMFYAPWCNYSKKTLPIIERISYEMREIRNFVVARIDSYNNDIDEEIKGFPTLRLYPAHNKTFIQYDGEKTNSLIKQFILSNIKQTHRIDL